MKRYKTNHGNLTTFVKVGEKTVRVKFVSSDNRFGYFATDNVDVQRALEKDSAFGVKFFIDDIVLQKIEKPLHSDVIYVNEVTSWQQAKKYLNKKPYGISYAEMKTPEDIRYVANKFKLVFNNIEGW